MRIVVVKKKTLLVALVGLLACAAAVALTVWLSDAGLLPTMARMAQVEEYELNVLPGKKRELPVYSVERPDQKIALTIDAAWEDDKTAFILETLARYDVKATFFLCGVWVEAYPEHVKEIAAAGHEIGNHSLTHPHMNELTAEQVQQEISALDDQIEALTGKRCTKIPSIKIRHICACRIQSDNCSGIFCQFSTVQLILCFQCFTHTIQ